MSKRNRNPHFRKHPHFCDWCSVRKGNHFCTCAIRSKRDGHIIACTQKITEHKVFGAIRYRDIKGEWIK